MKGEITVNHVHLETPLVINEQITQLLIVENPAEFYNVVCDLNNQLEGESGTFVFLREGQPILPSACGAMVTNIFNFDLNDKKILNQLYKKMEGIALGDCVSAFNELNAKTFAFITEISYQIPFSLDYNELQPSDYFKSAGVKLEKNYDSLEEKIVCYINALIELKKCEFFIFVNLKSVLNDEKLALIYSHCQKEQVGLLLVESCKQRPLKNNERAVIITEDLCEIVENY